MLQGNMTVVDVEELGPYTVIDNALDVELSLHHRSGQRAEFDSDFLVIGDGDGSLVLVRNEETYP